MFSFQSHNQVLCNLSQVAAAFSPRRTIRPLNSETKSAQKGIQQHNDIDTPICCESFNEVLKNCSKSILENFSSLKISVTDGSAKINSRNLSWRPSRTKSLPWLVSYKSADSFYENKHGSLVNSFPVFPNIAVSTKFHRSILQSNYCRNPLVLGVSARGFKTERSIQSEKARNPSLILRLRESLKPNLPGSTTHDGHIDRLVDSETERLKGLISSDSLSPEEQQRMKVAFAEGYLAGNGVRSPGRTMKWLKVIQQLLMITIFLAIFISLMASTSGSVFRVQLGSQIEVDPEEIHITFADVKGVDEAKQELKDVVEFLKNPEKFSALGGKLPKGVLLVGPPGTGKTLLARAVAGEAGVPFFHAAGPEFDEILVGQGARRVRDLFKAAKDRAPCVIFIDEIDSVGAKRTNSVLHPYANQTINQLLSEMDGFHQNEGVIVLGATNRRDDLDKALLRPGRFDVEVTVPVPDYVGRKEILDLYLGRILSKDVDVEMLARGTTGFTGADLENMVNQAALRAAIDGADSVSMKHLENARDKVLMGPERKSRIPDEEANTITAYHEGGHAIVAYYTKDSHPLHKVTIIPRGPSLGHTAYIPEKERYHVTKSQLMAMLDTMMGGRAAEELIFGPDKITSGASSDLKQATSIATHMVKEWGMSEKVGLRTYDNSNKSLVVVNELSPGTAELIDSEIKRLMMESYERAKSILKAHHKEHKLLAEALLKYETLDAEDIKAIMKGKDTSDRSQPV
ncbi:ATP-dependent zinc metalloprotease YME1L-like [Schistocerca gregaria]|uniref:ATP-dependent zinc metalloprotease YME1L-like n=1 Tax=Schistocerca gregaria TaxID=7010 RepID=UPI00211DBCEF|nr:ATP-dependent zinc metalloprotease YME1L-like [Schistocerca gregaria]